MPIGGLTGTLSDRYTQSQARGLVRAKTGSLPHVTALSGTVLDADVAPARVRGPRRRDARRRPVGPARRDRRVRHDARRPAAAADRAASATDVRGARDDGCTARRRTAVAPTAERALRPETGGYRDGVEPSRNDLSAGLVDWQRAATIAGRLATPGPTAERGQLQSLVDELRDAAGRAAVHVATITRLDGRGRHRPGGRLERARGRPAALGAGQRGDVRRDDRAASTCPRATGARAARRGPGGRRPRAAVQQGPRASSTRSRRRTAPPAGCCSSRPTCCTTSASSRSTRRTSGSGSRCTSRPTRCSSPRRRGSPSTCARGPSELLADLTGDGRRARTWCGSVTRRAGRRRRRDPRRALAAPARRCSRRSAR